MSQKLTLHEASKRGDVEQCNLLVNDCLNDMLECKYKMTVHTHMYSI